MFCPKCGNHLTDMFAEKCLSCGMSFKNLSLAERRKLEKQPMIQNSKRPVISQKFSKTNVKNTQKSSRKTTEVRVEYNNGYVTKEGMSKSGRKFKKGSFKKRANNEGIGFKLPAYGLGEYPY